jgi:hypothetical protein
MNEENVRPSAVAGSFYPGDPKQLRQMINAYLQDASPPKLQGVRAVICPHAGYIYSAPIAAFGFKLLEDGPTPQRIYLLGPAHRAWFEGVALAGAAAFRTPLGEAPVDQGAVERLAEHSPLFNVLPRAHAGEHSLEVQLPFLQTVYPSIPVVPLLFGQVDAAEVGRALNEFLSPEEILVVSSDLSHYHNHITAQRLDRAFIESVLEGEKEEVRRGEACGRMPIETVMVIAEERNWKPHLLDYRTSGETAGDRQQVVGYASIAYTEE